jgi:hypothetical protein
MKTITEFSGVLLQRAAEVQRTFQAANPQVAVPAAEKDQSSQTGEDAPSADVEAADVAAPSEEAVAVEGAAEATADVPASSDDGGAVEPSSDDGGAAEASPAEPAAPVDLGTGPEAEAVGEALQVEGDRLSRLMEALDVVGRRVAQVRLVRVLQGENPPQGAQKRGDYYYAVDLAPRPQSQQRDGFDGRDGDRRRGPGGRDRGGRPGDRGPGGARGAGGPPGKGGKFSNDRPSSRDGDMREGRGEMPRAGAGWMLTRAPDDRRGRSDEPGVNRRDGRPPRGPRFDGPRPPQGPRGDRPPRGPRPDRPGGRPGFSGPPRPEGGGERPQAAARPEGRGAGFAPDGRRGLGPRRPEPGRPDGPGPRRDDRNWSGRRRGGWDEPAVPEAAASAAPVAESPAPVENLPAPVTDTAAPVAVDSSATPPPTENG